MATKRITDLTLRSDFSATCNVPVDDTIQSYRVTGQQILDYIRDQLNEPGVIQAYGGTSAPTGWLLCDGSAISRTTYAGLYAIVGNNFGQGDGSTTFNLPDLRGRFLRGHDDGAGNDDDAGTRTASATGGNTGDNVGSKQDDAFQGHNHVCYVENGGSGTNGNYIQKRSTWGNRSNGSTFPDVNGSSDAIRQPKDAPNYGTAKFSTETRPKNVAVSYIIKV